MRLLSKLLCEERDLATTPAGEAGRDCGMLSLRKPQHADDTRILHKLGFDAEARCPVAAHMQGLEIGVFPQVPDDLS
jgi:hypothetical protein